MRRQQRCELDAILRGWAGQYNNPDFIKSDPIQFPHKYDGRKAEVSGFITAWLSFGNRKAIVEKAGEIDASFMGDPYSWVMTRDYRNHFNNHGKIYRFLSHHDLYLLGKRLHELYMSYETMEEYVMSQLDKHPVQSLSEYFHGINGIADYGKGSACKRLCMFLRWMVRNDGLVDMGLWQHISPTELIIPLDTHVHKVALELGITDRKQADMKTAMMITDYFRGLFPEDPALGDFSLFGVGINRNLLSK